MYVPALGERIYAMTPCTEAAALCAVESMQQRPLMVLEDPTMTKALPAQTESTIEDEYEDDEDEDDEDESHRTD